jgi:hypothetical protein
LDSEFITKAAAQSTDSAEIAARLKISIVRLPAWWWCYSSPFRFSSFCRKREITEIRKMMRGYVPQVSRRGAAGLGEL